MGGNSPWTLQVVEGLPVLRSYHLERRAQATLPLFVLPAGPDTSCPVEEDCVVLPKGHICDGCTPHKGLNTVRLMHRVRVAQPKLAGLSISPCPSLAFMPPAHDSCRVQFACLECLQARGAMQF